jgi:hypothetical protein
MTPFLSELYAHLHLEQAGELFAAELWNQLDATEARRRNGHLSEETMTPAEIRRLTFSALLAAHQHNYRPSGALLALIGRLLGALERRRDAMKNPKAWCAAFKLQVENPRMGVRELARRLGVPPSFISRMQRTEFWKRVFRDVAQKI